jgi:L-ascorbate metabolism protein UlaG (beta-lactamase superfamily)
MSGRNRYAALALLLAVLAGCSGCPGGPKEEPLINEDGYRYKDLRILWLSHDGFRIKSRDMYIYIDPFLVKEGPKAGLILLTSEYPDHLDLSSISQVMAGDTVIMAPSSASKKLAWRFTALSPGDETRFKWLRIAAIDVSAKKPRPGDQSQLGYVLHLEGVTFFHSGDIRNADDIKDNPDIAELQSKLDILAVAIGGTHTMNEDGAAAVTKYLSPKIVIPMHYGALPETSGRPELLSRKLRGEAVQVVTTR